MKFYTNLEGVIIWFEDDIALSLVPQQPLIWQRV